VTGTSGPTVTVNKPFNLAPDSSSMITFGPYYEKTVLYNNHISGKIGSAQSTGGRAGIEPYGCSLNLIADHNSIQHVGGALSVWAMPGASQETATYFNLFSNNKIKDCNVGSAIYFTDWGANVTMRNVKTLMGNVFRNNSTIDSAGYSEYAYGGLILSSKVAGGADMNVFDSDTSSGFKIAIAASDTATENMIYYNNTIKGDTGINFSQGILPDLRDNSYPGCTLDYSGTFPGDILEAPYRVFQINVPVNGTGTVKVPVWDGGTAALTWDALVNVSWLSYTPILNTVNTEDLTDTILVSCNAATLPTSPDTAYMTLTAGSQVKKVTIIAILNSSTGVTPTNENKLSSIFVYPNPSNGIFTIKIRNEELGMRNSVEVYNTFGGKVYSQFDIQNSTLNLDLFSQPNGIYLYRVLQEDGRLAGEGKFVIQH